MKKYGTFIALGLAVLFGIAAVFLANRVMTARGPEEKVVLQESVPLGKIVVAAQDVTVGTRLQAENLTMAQWPKANIPKGAFEDISKVEGRVTVSKMVAGRPVLAAETADPGSGVGLVAMIKPGMRAMAIRVDEVTGVGGFILPNTFVDIIAVETEGKSRKADTILRKIEVLAIAQETLVEEGKPKLVRTVTLELKPDQAETLAMQTNRGPIHLVLRNPLDEVEPEPVVEKKVAAKPAPRPRPAPVVRPRVYEPGPPSPYEVEVIRGAKPPEVLKFQQHE